MSWSEETIKERIWVHIDRKNKTVNMTLDDEKTNSVWRIEVGGFKWKIDFNQHHVWEDTYEDWKTRKPCLMLKHNCLEGSNLWETDAELHYTIDIESEEPFRFHGVSQKKLNFLNNWEVNNMLCRENIRKICEGISPSEEWVEKIYEGSITLKLRIKNRPKLTLTPTLSLLEETEGFSNIEIVFVNGEKLYANRETLSDCSQVFEKLFNEDLDRSAGLEKIGLENISLEIFHSFLKLMHPNCEQGVDENKILAMMQLGVTFQAPCVLRSCERLLINSEKEYSVEDINQFLKFAEDNDLNQLQTWCFEKMYDEKCRLEQAKRQAELAEKRSRHLKRAEEHIRCWRRSRRY